MVGPRERRDKALIDAVEAYEPTPYSGKVWRAVRDGRDPTSCSPPGGRWDDGTFDVLYASQQREGAVAEIYFHLARGQPVFPSQVRYRLYELQVSISRAFVLVDLEALARIGIETARYGQLSYEERTSEYPRSQDVAEVAHFLEFDGLIVPSARRNCLNVVLFCDRVSPPAIEVQVDHGLVDWAVWEAQLKGG